MIGSSIGAAFFWGRRRFLVLCSGPIKIKKSVFQVVGGWLGDCIGLPMNHPTLPSRTRSSGESRSRKRRGCRRLVDLLALAGLCLASGVAADPAGADSLFAREVVLERAASGSLYVQASTAGVEASFLVDTGAGLVTVQRGLFEKMRRSGEVREVRRVAARLANNRLKPMTVYEVAEFRIGGSCNLGPVEIAVMEQGGRNLLGLSALGRAAPFTIHTSPPALVLNGCRDGAAIAAVD
jgi:hypothetical protein